MRTDAHRKYAASRRASGVEETNKMQTFCSFPIDVRRLRPFPARLYEPPRRLRAPQRASAPLPLRLPQESEPSRRPPRQPSRQRPWRPRAARRSPSVLPEKCRARVFRPSRTRKWRSRRAEGHKRSDNQSGRTRPPSPGRCPAHGSAPAARRTADPSS